MTQQPSARPPGARRPSSRPRSRPPLGRLRRYRVENLFDMVTYDFDLDPHGPTLLTGVNGTGKSTILKTIDAVSTGSWLALVEFPFTALTLEFDTNQIFQINRTP